VLFKCPQKVADESDFARHPVCFRPSSWHEPAKRRAVDIKSRDKRGSDMEIAIFPHKLEFCVSPLEKSLEKRHPKLISCRMRKPVSRLCVSHARNGLPCYDVCFVIVSIYTLRLYRLTNLRLGTQQPANAPSSWEIESSRTVSWMHWR